MRKILLTALLSVFALGSITAQPARIDAAEGQLWWGYFDSQSERTTWGSKTPETYNMAINVSGSNPLMVGKAIKAIRFYMRTNSSVENLKVWVSKKLPATPEDADIEMQAIDLTTIQVGDEDATHAGIATDLALQQAYTINEEGVYVGYTFDVTSIADDAGKRPVVVNADQKHAGGFWLSTSRTRKTWKDVSSQFGDLAMQLLVEGEMQQNALNVADFAPVVTLLGQPANINIELTHAGLQPVSSFTYQLHSEGLDDAEPVEVTLDEPFQTPGQTFTQQIQIPASNEAGKRQWQVIVTKVNGQDNEAVANTANGVVTTIASLPVKRVVVEEYTGTACGWCPRGLVGMQNLRHAFGDRFVGIGLHQYNSSDAMYISQYRAINFSGAPQCTMDRGAMLDPYYGSDNSTSIVEDVQVSLNATTNVGVDVAGQWTDDGNSVMATANITPVDDYPAGYRVELVLIADSLTGTGSAWNQANYYNQYQQSQLPDDLKQFGAGGVNGGSYILGWAFDDVALFSTVNKISTLPALSNGQVEEVSYELPLPTKSNLRPAVDEAAQKGHVAVCALLVRPDGKIENANKFYLPALIPTGIEDVEIVNRKSVNGECYDLSGRRVSDSSRPGLYIQNGKKVVRR